MRRPGRAAHRVQTISNFISQRDSHASNVCCDSHGHSHAVGADVLASSDCRGGTLRGGTLAGPASNLSTPKHPAGSTGRTMTRSP
jgi:hypothetical protein